MPPEPHGHGHRHGHHHGDGLGERRLGLAIAINLALTAVQVAGGILSGSLALIADALHNFSDAASLVIAYAARRIGRRPADARMTFGYGRAEIVAALVNYTTLIMLGLYLGVEAVLRLLEPQPIEGWTVVAVATVALAIDAATALLTYRPSKDSMNIKAAFLHNVADALASLGVIVGGVIILLYDWTIVDPLLTLVIAGYVLWHGCSEIGAAIRILMLGAPDETDPAVVIEAVQALDGIADVHHVHLWRLDERRVSLEAHLVLDDGATPRSVKERVRAMLRQRFDIDHVTLETEALGEACQAAGGLPR